MKREHRHRDAAGCHVSDLEKIVSIELKGNRLEGTIPPEIFEFITTMVRFNVASNDLNGQIPHEIGMLTDINILELAENQLTSIPDTMGNLSTLDHVFLQTNNFGGQAMPSQICALRNAGTMTFLWADCRGDQEADLVCDPSCCTTCFDGPSKTIVGGVPAAENNVFEGTKSDEAVTHADSQGDVLATLKKLAPGESIYSSSSSILHSALLFLITTRLLSVSDGGESLDDSLSPQFKAYSWLVSSNYESLSDILLLQRYGLATLYFR